MWFVNWLVLNEERETESRTQRQTERGTETRDRQAEGSSDGNIHERGGAEGNGKKTREAKVEDRRTSKKQHLENSKSPSTCLDFNLISCAKRRVWLFLLHLRFGTQMPANSIKVYYDTCRLVVFRRCIWGKRK